MTAVRVSKVAPHRVHLSRKANPAIATGIGAGTWPKSSQMLWSGSAVMQSVVWPRREDLDYGTRLDVAVVCRNPPLNIIVFAQVAS